jgi:hypothetical protein
MAYDPLRPALGRLSESLIAASLAMLVAASPVAAQQTANASGASAQPRRSVSTAGDHDRPCTTTRTTGCPTRGSGGERPCQGHAGMMHDRCAQHMNAPGHREHHREAM